MGTKELKLETAKGIFTIRPYEKGDEKQILLSWNQAFGKKMSLDHWKWKYPDNPQGFRCLLCLSEDGTVIIHYAAQIMKISFHGETILGLHITDSFSHPKFRWAIGGKSGLFIKAGRAFLNTYLEKIETAGEIKLATHLPLARFHYGFPGERHYRLGAKLLTYRLHRPGLVYMHRQPLKKSNFTLASIKYRIESSCVNAVSCQDMDALWHKFQKKSAPFSTVRNAEFIKWRFGARPDRRYRLYCLRHFLSKTLVAWLILDLSREGNIKIIDFLALSGEAMTELLKRVVREEKERGMEETWLAGNHPFLEAFERAGFSPGKEPLGIIPNTRCDMLSADVSPDSADKFFFTMADGDLF